VTDTAHRAAASRSIRAHLDAGHKAWLARKEQSEAQRSSLIRLAKSAIELHAVAMAKGVKPWADGEGPLSVACAALKTVAKNEGVLK
jgi:hypothetical protein